MKIICIGRNYAAHIEELGNERPENPVIFLKPDTAILRNNDAFFYPEYSSNIHYEVEVFVRINKEGKSIHPSFAHGYYDEIGLGIDFTARDLQQKAKEKGLPWDISKGFNSSAPVSRFIRKDPYDLTNLAFHLDKNGERVQTGNTQLMLFPINELIAYISQFYTLKKGDLIFTGTPEGVGPVQIGDRLEGYIEEQKMFDFEIK